MAMRGQHRTDYPTNANAPPTPEQISRLRSIVYSILPLLLLFLLLEAGLRIVYYQRHSSYRLAVIHAFYSARTKIVASVQHAKAEKTQPDLPPGFWSEIYGEDGRALFQDLKAQYEHHFTRLVQAAAGRGTLLAALYIPSVPVCRDDRLLQRHRSFYADLAARHKVSFLDMTEDFQKYPLETVTLLPENGHLSRFGNKLAAERLLRFIASHSNHRVPEGSGNRPRLLGDLKPGTSEIWEFVPSMPYKVVVNPQGLRMARDVAFPKTRQRILCLGDSFTFGPYLPNHDTYPELLQKMSPDIEVLNGGVCGYTVSDEADLFIERARYAEPDITTLQMHDNDLTGFLYFRQRQFSRDHKIPEPTELEKAFLKKLWNKAGSVNGRGPYSHEGRQAFPER